ncbi:MAG: B12-binding domain-containing radical SAM protein [Candidatus Brocadiales bacterium]
MRVILLEHPRPEDPERFQDVVNAPLSACLTTGYIASVLHANNIQVEIVDANLYGWSVERTIAELCKKPFDILGVHTVYLCDNTKSIFDMLLRLQEQRAGERLPRPYINLYGYYPTFAYERILLEYPFIDSVAIGEPEFTFLELAQKIMAGLKNPHYDTSGIAYGINNTKVIKNKPRQLIADIDNLPFPLRNAPHTQRGGQDAGEKRGVHTYILGSRGCYGNCTFCYINPFYGEDSLWRGRSPENIVEEISQLHERHKINYFYFADANFLGPGEYGKERARKLSELIIRNGLKIGFGIECRANDVEEKTFSSLVHAGLKHVFLGIESGSQTSLNRFKKGVSVEVNKRAIQTVRQFGIEPSVGFIMFEPYSTLSDIRANFDFFKEMKLLTTPSVTAHLLYHKETLFQGTPDYFTIFNENRAKCKSFTEYEAAYTFKDERVAMLSTLATHICQKALNQIEITDCGVLGRSLRSGEHYSAFENQALIDSFEQGLRDLEACGEPIGVAQGKLSESNSKRG